MILLGRFDVQLPGDVDGQLEKHVWEPDEVTLGEQLMLEREAGTSYIEWINACGRGEAQASQILVWFLRRKAGREQDRLSVDFKIRRLEIIQIPDEGEADDDPEAPAGSEPATASPSSSITGSSPTGSTS